MFLKVAMKRVGVLDAHSDGFSSFETEILSKEKPIFNDKGFIHYSYVFLQKAYSLSMD